MKIYVHQDDKAAYPEPGSLYNPHVHYPEYPWDKNDISAEENKTYDMVRNCLYSMGYDKGNYGTRDWNPLGDIIRPGQTVLIKPNWVMHKNKNKGVKDNLACLVTHPSVVRAVIDYAVIALKGSGRIILGDAPMQGADLEKMFSVSGYGPLFDFVAQKDINIQIADFRKYRTISSRGVLSAKIPIQSGVGSFTVDLGEMSCHFENDGKSPLYKVSDYPSEQTAEYHGNKHHIYEISEAVILSDAIINLPKPKTHRLSGITGAMKNFVGITHEKACLPHRTEGDKQSGKGDSYRKASKFKRWMFLLDEKKTAYSNKNQLHRARIADVLHKACYLFGWVTTGDEYRIGSWYGNDTIWRTIIDLNRIIKHTDKDGILCGTPQRKILHIGDMIVCGEKNGPIGPAPKKLGAIMISDDGVCFDYVFCKITGFDDKHIPSVREAILRDEAISSQLKKAKLNSNIARYTDTPCTDFEPPPEWQFIPHDCWDILRKP